MVGIVVRCEHMDDPIYEGDERREGRDGAERAFDRVFSSNL